MAEENNTQSSDESLPLSQETFACLWDEIKESPVADAVGGNLSDNYDVIPMCVEESGDNPIIVENISAVQRIGALSASIQVPQALLIPNVPFYTPSSLPATENWPGNYLFTVSFNQQERNTKAVTWTYSELKNKLYVCKDTPCPINFSTNTTLGNVSIRAMALFSSPDHATEVVHRCVNHSMDEITKGVFEAEHLIRCESNMASYQVDQVTGRHSVVVPFDNPPAGQLFSTYIYKFACFGSCAGGPNRRPLILIFTLEKGEEVIGRCKIEIKICACPGRDRKNEENQSLQLQKNQVPPKQKETSGNHSNTPARSLPLKPGKKLKVSEDKEGPYILKVYDKDCFDFLKQMKKFFELSKKIKNFSPEVKAFILNNRRDSEDDESQ